jgi:hypothetical protein
MREIILSSGSRDDFLSKLDKYSRLGGGEELAIIIDG